MLIHSASGHAIERYRERCSKEHLTFQECRKQLLELARNGDFQEKLPAWIAAPATNVEVAGYVLVADSLALPVTAGGVVTTVLARGDFAPVALEHRRKGRRARAGYLRHQSGKSRSQGVRGRRPDPEWA